MAHMLLQAKSTAAEIPYYYQSTLALDADDFTTKADALFLVNTPVQPVYHSVLVHSNDYQTILSS